MSEFKNGTPIVKAESLYSGSTSFIDTSTIFVNMTRDELWAWYKAHGYLNENPLVNTKEKKR